MNYVVAYTTEFVIDGSDDETVDDVLSSMGSDFLEENLKWNVSDYEEPIISDMRLAEPKDSIVPEVSEQFYQKFKEVEKEIYVD